MFAPIVLPIQITAAVFVVLWCACALALRTPKKIAWMSFAAVLLFVPSCVGVRVIVDSQRYGRFDYAAAPGVPSDKYIRIPVKATNITLYRGPAGHHAKFTIDTPSLRIWVDDCRAARPDLNQHLEGKEWPVRTTSPGEFASRFPNTGWSHTPSMLNVHVSLSDRGGGFTLWHLSATGETYLSAAYW